MPHPPIVDVFCDLVRIDSPSGHERRVADHVAEWLAERGISSAFDGTADAVRSDAGNLIATLHGEAAGPHLLFVTHLDTVQHSNEHIEPEVVDGFVRPAGETILGADNKSAVAAAMRALETLAAISPRHRTIISVAFTCNEEAGVMGASVLEVAGIGADIVVAIDGSEPVGSVMEKALGQRTFLVTVKGRGAHAAKEPEAGRNAVAAAAQIVGALPLGRQEHGGSLNVGAVLGGSLAGVDLSEVQNAVLEAGTNSIPDRAWIRGEARGFNDDDIAATLALVKEAADEAAATTGTAIDIEYPSDGVPPFTADLSGPGMRVVEAATAARGLAADRLTLYACLEANYLGPKTDTVAVASAGSNAHTRRVLSDPNGPYEHVAVAELVALEGLLVEFARQAAALTE